MNLFEQEFISAMSCLCFWYAFKILPAKTVCDGRVAEVPHQHVEGDGLCPFRDKSTVTKCCCNGH